MPLEAPNLDDRTYDDLVREAQLRIPRYCPEWTDFNPADPGTALVELFAWFTELMLYRMNKVPERNYIKFLELLNLQPRPALPAKAHVVLTPTERSRPDDLKIRNRTRFEVPAGGEPLYFETTGALDLNPYPLDAVQVEAGGEFQDYSTLNTRAADNFRPLGWIPQVGNALYLGFKPLPPDKDGNFEAFPQFPERLTLRVFLPATPPMSKRAVARTNAPANTVPNLIWEFRSKLDLAKGQTQDRWRRIDVLNDDSLAFTREGTIELRSPGDSIRATLEGKPSPDGQARYWIRARLAPGIGYTANTIPEIAFLRSNVVEIENLATFQNEPLGEADGYRANFKLRNAPVDPASVKIEIEGDSDPEIPWVRKLDFLASQAVDKHFVIEPSTGEVMFGNGERGQIPAPGGIVIAREYRAGGGAAGNVAAKAITSPPAGVAGLDSVENPRPAIGGTDEEKLDDLKARAPQVLRGGGRAVTADDFRQAAEAVYGVAKATVLERYHPDYPGCDIPGAVTVVVAPVWTVPANDPNPNNPPRPTPTQELLDRVLAKLNRIRTVGVEVFTTGPKFVRLDITVTVVPSEGVTDSEAKEGVKRAIEDALAPVPRPRPVEEKTPPTSWPFGEILYPSRLYEWILNATKTNSTLRLVRSTKSLFVRVNGTNRDLGLPVEFDSPELCDALPIPVVAVEIDTGGPRK